MLRKYFRGVLLRNNGRTEEANTVFSEASEFLEQSDELRAEVMKELEF